MRSSLYFVLVVHTDRGSAWAAFLREIPNYSLLHNNTLSTHQCVSLVYKQGRNHHRRPSLFYQSIYEVCSDKLLSLYIPSPPPPPPSLHPSLQPPKIHPLENWTKSMKSRATLQIGWRSALRMLNAQCDWLIATATM